MHGCSATLWVAPEMHLSRAGVLWYRSSAPSSSQQCCQGPFCKTSFWPSYARSRGMRNGRCPFSRTAPAMADVVNQQKQERRSAVYQVGLPQSVSLYLCGWTGSQPHFCRRVLVCGTGRAHLFPETRNINFGIKIFSCVAHSNMCFAGKMTEPLQGTVLGFPVPS